MFFNGINLVITSVLVVGWLLLFYLMYLWIRRSGGIGLPKRTPKVSKGHKVPDGVPVFDRKTDDSTLLVLEVPKDNETTPLAAELMFSSLHGIYKPELDKKRGAIQERISFEMQAKEKSIRFFSWVPKHLQGYVEGQIYAQYPGVNILEVKDYAQTSDEFVEGSHIASAELVLTREDLFPIKSFDSFEVDPLAAITATLSKLQGDAQVWVQIVVRPENNRWRDRAINYISAVRSGKQAFGAAFMKGLASLASDVMKTAVIGEVPASEEKRKELAPGVEDALKKIEEKSAKLGFQTKIRIVAFDKSGIAAQQKVDLVVGSFKQFNTTNLNGFDASVAKPTARVTNVLEEYRNREFVPSAKSSVLNVTELASIYHLPNKSVVTPNIEWAGSKKGEPPATLPLADEVDAKILTKIGITDFRGNSEKFGIKMGDRYRHVYIIGKSGVGKSVLLENMTLDDVKERRGCGVVDPHGEYVDYILDRIPSYRINDVVLFDLGDREYPIGFNVLEVANDNQKPIVASGVVGVFKKIFGDSWGPRLEYWLSSAILALLDYPGATLMMIPRLYTDKAFRMEVLEHVKDPVIKARWINEFNTLDQRQVNETIGSILNKVGQFLSSPIIRNIVGQSKSAINMREAMDEGKILLIKLTKGAIGEDNMALIGSLLITQIQLAAMSRADIIDPEKRKPFFLFVDEFQNFATDSFATILSEARKYRLSLTMANQFMAQLSDTVKDAILGNVGTMITFRVGGNDAAVLVKEFAPVFDEQDLVNLDLYKIYLKLSIDGLTAGAFSATTLPPSTEVTNNREKIIAISREKYAKKASFVEGKIAEFNEASEGAPPAPSYNNPNRNRPNSGVSSSKGGFRKPSGSSGEENNYKSQQNDKFKNNKSQPSEGSDGILKNLISRIEKKRVTPFDDKQRGDVSKTLMDGLKDEGGSIKDALEKARERKKQEQKQAGELKPNEPIDLESSDDKE